MVRAGGESGGEARAVARRERWRGESGGERHEGGAEQDGTGWERGNTLGQPRPHDEVCMCEAEIERPSAARTAIILVRFVLDVVIRVLLLPLVWVVAHTHQRADSRHGRVGERTRRADSRSAAPGTRKAWRAARCRRSLITAAPALAAAVATTTTTTLALLPSCRDLSRRFSCGRPAATGVWR